MSKTEGTPGKAFVPIELEQFVELIAQRTLIALEARFNSMEKQIEVLTYAVEGNGVPGLGQQIRDLAKECKDAHEALHERISKRFSVTTKNGKEVNVWKERFLGGWYTIVGLAALGASIATIWKQLH
jgi:hypothetical protein